jgi:hypothetical protein
MDIEGTEEPQISVDLPPKVVALLTLSRVSNLPTVWANCLAAWLLGGGGFAWEFIPLLVGASLIYSGGMVINDAADVEFDGEHRPERPIPSGAISRTAAWGFGIAFIVFGIGGMAAAGVFVLWSLLLVVAVVIYDVLHKKWQPSVYVMGACRMLLYLAAASAAGAWWSWPVVIWGAALGVYTVGITVAARGEVSDQGVAWPGLAMLGAPIIAAGLTYMIRMDSHVMMEVCLAAWLGWTIYCVILLRGAAEGRVGKAVGLLIAGKLLIDALAVSSGWPWFALGLVLALPGVLLLQRKFAAT